MDWEKHFAKRTRHMRRSAIRELLKLTGHSDFISFGGGLPAAELFPLAQAKTAWDALIDRLGGKAFQYGETEGLAELRDWIAKDFAVRTGVKVHRDNVLITSGAQQGLDLVGRVFLDEGDRVILENPTYLALLSAWRPWCVEFLGVASDDHGFRVEEVEALIKQKPKLIYSVPNFQNPQGTTLALDRREELVRLGRQRGIPILEDDPYGALRYSGVSLPSLLELSQAHSKGSELDTPIIYAGTFSKTLMPGLRVGWLIADAAVIEKLVQAKQSADLHTSTICQHLALELASNGCVAGGLPELKRAYRARRDAMLEGLQNYFPAGTRWTRPEGGMFLMVTLPKDLDAGELLGAAIEQRVAFVPGEEFHLNGEGRNTMRLNFSNCGPERIEEGMRRLGRLGTERVGMRTKARDMAAY
jgi:2-aminoadipate transaminase